MIMDSTETTRADVIIVKNSRFLSRLNEDVASKTDRQSQSFATETVYAM